MSKPSPLYDLLKLSSLGLEMGAAVVIGLLVGSWLDSRFDTNPWLTPVSYTHLTLPTILLV